MKTSKPISTISYNTESFLAERIYKWKKLGLIEYGMWILHQPDVDGDKPHFHVYLQPAKMIQTEDFVNDSFEIDPNMPDKPLKMITFRNSKEEDWIPYSLHDKDYLADKGLSRNISYEPKDINNTCEDTFLDMLSKAYDKKNNKLEQRIMQAIQEGKNWKQIVSSGMVPVRLITGARLLYMAITEQDSRLN